MCVVIRDKIDDENIKIDYLNSVISTLHVFEKTDLFFERDNGIELYVVMENIRKLKEYKKSFEGNLKYLEL